MTISIEIENWLNVQRENCGFSFEKISADNLEQWHFEASGNLVHSSGKFFSIEGVTYHDALTNIQRWQPIINQPEQGILGLLTRRKEDTTEILLQAKAS